MDICCESCVVR